ncbi:MULTISPECIES: hypothetical protein [unclassified Paenibacillus]|uniref:hypothetical protein n=1 Tax=unclassified Paenibacillus TaxID=185978 RepID=UPI00277ECEBD|nr:MULTISPECIES: hypothetical protein [unclassified Paenibacillus]MDQ0896392.1 hypothetical protein [Paenibacillus sp. V4I7]MDQ0914064.1 hypothetical protein [Paenibacillus sp. V4I5]
MKFCLYEAINERIVHVENDIMAAVSARNARGYSKDISILPLLLMEEYDAFPASYRGEVSGRFYLLYEVPGVFEQRYDQVIVVERYDDAVKEKKYHMEIKGA